MRYCAIPTDSGVPVIVTSLSLPSPSLLAIFIIAPELTLRIRERERDYIFMDMFFLPYLMDFCSFSSNHTPNQLQKNKIKLLLFAKQNNEKHEYVTNSYLCV